MSEEKTYQEKYNDFWRDIVENEDGTLNKDQVMRELSDYSMVMDNCARAFYTMTNGRISKQNTKFFEVENIFNDLYTDTETYYEDMAEKDKEIERLNSIIKEVREYCINRSQYFNEARIEQYPFSREEEYSIENILEILDKVDKENI